MVLYTKIENSFQMLYPSKNGLTTYDGKKITSNIFFIFEGKFVKIN